MELLQGLLSQQIVNAQILINVIFNMAMACNVTKPKHLFGKNISYREYIIYLGRILSYFQRKKVLRRYQKLKNMMLLPVYLRQEMKTHFKLFKLLKLISSPFEKD